MKLRRILYPGSALLLFFLVFSIDVIRKNVELDVGGLDMLRHLMVAGAFVLVYLFVNIVAPVRDMSPVKRFGLLMIYSFGMLALGLVLGIALGDGFDAKNEQLLPLGYATVFIATVSSILFGLFAVLVLRLLHDLIMFKRKRWTRRNFLILIVLVFATAASTLRLKPLEGSTVRTVLEVAATIFLLINSVRLSWIVYLSKREKLFTLLYSFLLFAAFAAFIAVLRPTGAMHKSLLYYSMPLNEFVTAVLHFGTMYFGMTFVSTLFHLPTADAFERKTSEVSSLHNLSRLITQVFDFNELVDSVTQMTLQVCEAQSCWLEIIHQPEVAEGDAMHYHVQVVGMKNITQPEIDRLLPQHARTLRDMAIEQRRPIAVDNVRHDERFRHLEKGKGTIGSLVVAPLVSHAGLVGILYATKATEYGFFKDDVDVVSAFADQATIAIENSRLIKRSIERERLMREMGVAQEIQRKLLPQSVPQFRALELDAVSTPAFEVGGDYYDFVLLDGNRLGIVVGDVSGKGVSAAFYMSEMKGIFQSLSRLYPSPRDFMVRANEALRSSIDKHSFVTLLYAVLDVTTGVLTLSRAGHCPMLYLSGAGDVARYIRPSGIGLGMIDGSTFLNSIAEVSVSLHPGDVCVFYTDGVTEARRGDEEFGYERLMQTVQRSKQKSAVVLKEEILQTVQGHLDQQANEDDLTLVVLRWRGHEHAT